MLMPNNGRLLNARGRIAQCMAHAIETVTPNTSQLILKKDIRQK